MRTLAMSTIGFLFMGLTASLLGCSGSTPAGHEATQGGSSGSPAADLGGSGGAAVAVGGSNAGSSGSSSVAGGASSSGGASAGGSSGGSGGIGTAGASQSSACDKSMATWTDTSDLYASQDFGPNFLRKNFWNSKVTGAGTLTLWAASSRCWGVDATSVDDTSNAGTVKSYPDMARGWVVGTAGFQNKNSGLPIQVKDLTKAKIRWKMTVSGSPMRHYALWDIYFHDTATPGRGTATANLMIKQRVVDPSNYEQDKESAGSAAVTHTFGGITFRENKNTGLKSGSRIVVELFATPVNGVDMGIDDMTLDLKEVIDFYVKDGSLLATDYLTSIQAGWEVVAGGTFVTNDFWTALQDEPEPTP